ncbi:hypothetical protein NDU88_005203 [Pleurodeles waltl]|uniref:Secreted protein n=1 Tax=Pleurodeles waltl TaxID=8319 RepID=A0AAV7UI36_PLEWA|nr:hypothetical protein NDU88_005203 [Pleurodeles waltl]
MGGPSRLFSGGCAAWAAGPASSCVGPVGLLCCAASVAVAPVISCCGAAQLVRRLVLSADWPIVSACLARGGTAGPCGTVLRESLDGGADSSDRRPDDRDGCVMEPLVDPRRLCGAY